MITATFTVKLPLLKQTLSNTPGLILTIDPGQFPFVGEPSAKLLVWATGDEPDFDHFEARVEDDPTVEKLTLLDTQGSKRLYRADFPRDDLEDLFATLFYDHDTLLVRGTITENGWEFKVRALDRSALSIIHDELQEQEASLHIHTIHSQTGEQPQTLLGRLSENQFTALKAAVDRGYFEVPRKVTQTELATEFEISSQAFSERLRRAIGAVLTDVFDDSSE
ncbi:helix-turn-helix domain-containing protein [Halegenticoccus tardaugens]|uniref:helix-turn-helix domain-containing protein n=1 Tax=Halegenticoccus tardaugens TaxID=2071624 RepID=UPI00100BCE81|nr:helix-turn-helix domain-containing protein [Halegenticoccus tardaugens]